MHSFTVPGHQVKQHRDLSGHSEAVDILIWLDRENAKGSQETQNTLLTNLNANRDSNEANVETRAWGRQVARK